MAPLELLGSLQTCWNQTCQSSIIRGSSLPVDLSELAESNHINHVPSAVIFHRCFHQTSVYRFLSRSSHLGNCWPLCAIGHKGSPERLRFGHLCNTHLAPFGFSQTLHVNHAPSAVLFYRCFHQTSVYRLLSRSSHLGNRWPLCAIGHKGSPERLRFGYLRNTHLKHFGFSQTCWDQTCQSRVIRGCRNAGLTNKQLCTAVLVALKPGG